MLEIGSDKSAARVIYAVSFGILILVKGKKLSGRAEPLQNCTGALSGAEGHVDIGSVRLHRQALHTFSQQHRTVILHHSAPPFCLPA